MILCKCDTNIEYSQCCARFIENAMLPQTPLELMRSRYTAYTQANIDYIINTMYGEPLKNFAKLETITWANQVLWQKLEVINNTQLNNKGFVEFKAYYIDNSHSVVLHEISEFKRKNGKWFYINGQIV